MRNDILNFGISYNQIIRAYTFHFKTKSFSEKGSMPASLFKNDGELLEYFYEIFGVNAKFGDFIGNNLINHLKNGHQLTGQTEQGFSKISLTGDHDDFVELQGNSVLLEVLFKSLNNIQDYIVEENEDSLYEMEYKSTESTEMEKEEDSLEEDDRSME